MIFLSVDAVGLFPQTTDYREEDRGAAGPVSRITLPEIFFSTIVFDALKLRSMLRDFNL
jgi:hypothetical protein